MKTVIEMAREVWSAGDVYIGPSEKTLELFAEIVRADERNSWPAEMEAMERQVNILTDALAEQPSPAAQQELFGWAILHSDGTDAYIRPRLTNFFGQLQEREPFGNGDLEQCDIESAGQVPHRMIELYIRKDTPQAQPAPVQQEPVASVRTWHKNSDQHAELDDWGLALALLPDGKHDLYATPQAQRKPLTDEQLRSMCKQTWVFETVMQWARVIEAAHNIKENT